MNEYVFKLASVTSLTNELGVRLQELQEVLSDIPDEKWPVHMMSIDKPSLTNEETAELNAHWSQATEISGMYRVMFTQLASFAQKWRQAIRTALNDLPSIAPLINSRDAAPENQCSALIRRGLQELLSSYNRGQAMDVAPSNIPDKHVDVLSPMLERYKVMRKHFEHVRRIRDAIGDGAVPELRMPSQPLPAAVVSAIAKLDSRINEEKRSIQRKVRAARAAGRRQGIKLQSRKVEQAKESELTPIKAQNLLAQSPSSGDSVPNEKEEWRRLSDLERQVVQAMYEKRTYIKESGKRPSQATVSVWVGCRLNTNLKNALSTLVKAGYMDNLKQRGRRGGYGLLPKGERAGQHFTNGHD